MSGTREALESATTTQAAPISISHRNWALGLLCAIYASNFIDRTIVTILQQPIKLEFGLADWQLGLLGGASFAIFYTLLGVPVARLADRHRRSTIIIAAVAIWSVMTGLCGMAQTYWQLLLARVGVGAGEAGGAPPAHSLLADYFPPEQRATALAIYSLGLPFGAMIGAIGAGFVAQHWGWRVALIAAALPGLVLAMLAVFTLKEPVRGGLDRGGQAGGAPSLMSVARLMLSRRSMVHIIAASTLAAFAGYGIGGFNGAYFMRAFQLDIGEVGLLLGLVGGLSAALGTFLGGVIADRAGRVDPRWRMWTPALGLALAAPLYACAYLAGAAHIAAALLIAPSLLHYLYLGPSYGALQNLMSPRARATALALLSLVVNLIGLGLGPLAVGALSDLCASLLFTVGDFGADCTGDALKMNAAQCAAASVAGLRWSILAAIPIFIWAAAHFLLAAKYLHQDWAKGG